MKFTGRLQLPFIDVAAYRQAVMEELTAQMIKGVVAWLTTVDVLVPVWSGASKATFSELAEKVNFRLSIVRAARAPDRTAEGRARGEGSFEVDERTGTVVATYQTSLAHLVFNEFNNANNGGDPRVFSRLLRPGPYGFLDQANAAFEAAITGTELPIPRVIKRTVRF